MADQKVEIRCDPAVALKTARLRLQPFGACDAPQLAALLADPQVSAWLPDAPRRCTQVQALNIINLNTLRMSQQKAIHLALVRQADGAVIGEVSFEARGREIGVWLGSPWWRQGYGREAIGAMVQIVQGPVVANIHRSNRASCQLFEHCGFRFMGLAPRRLGRQGLPTADPQWLHYRRDAPACGTPAPA